MISQNAGTRQRAYCKQSFRRHTRPADDGAFRRDVDSKLQRVESRKAALNQAAQCRVDHFQRRGADLTAFNDLINMHGFDRRRAASAIADQDVFTTLLYSAHLRRHHLQAARCNRCLDTPLDFRCHAMPMHFPPGPGMLEEAAPRLHGQLLPDLLHERPDAVEHRAPVTAMSCVLFDPDSAASAEDRASPFRTARPPGRSAAVERRGGRAAAIRAAIWRGSARCVRRG